jgi:hypothetical protein
MLAICLSTYKNFQSFRTHFANFHLNNDKEIPNSEIFECKKENCNYLCESRNEILKHSRTHFPGEVLCPFCTKRISNKKYFEVHISRQHRAADFTGKFNKIDQKLITSFEKDKLKFDEIQIPNEEEVLIINQANSSQRKILLELFLKLKTEHFVSEEVIQCLVNEFQLITEEFQENVDEKVNVLCDRKKIDLSNKDYVSSELQSIEIFPQIKDMKTAYMREKQYKNSSHYVEPLEILLGFDNYHKKSFFHYVPIQATIKNLIIAYGVNKFFAPASPGEENLFADITDGSVYRKNLFLKGERKIEIMLYQDAFELCICIGSARKKFKLLGVYMAFGNIPKEERFKSENVQLVGLCRNKFLTEFGMEAIMKPFIMDVKLLETEGIQIDQNVYHGTVIGVAGDNLGQHQLSGLTENFSTTSHICRYCYGTLKDLKAGKLNVNEERTIESHKNDVQKLQNLNNIEHIAGTKQTLHINGVKTDCLLNSLSHFHCFLPGLPPCVAHDLFEGVIQYDLAFLIHEFADKKQEYYDFLNITFTSIAKETRAGVSFPKLDKKMTKLPGKAYENYKFLLLLPYVTFGLHLDRDVPAWKMFLCLLVIVRIICAFSVTEGQIILLESTIAEYFFYRAIATQTPLRPKHHYLCHYPMLIRYFGPLRYWWTLRFEAVHQFYKRSQTSAKNYINVTKSLCHRRQLRQVLINERRQRTNQKNEAVFINNKSSLDLLRSIVTVSEKFDCATTKLYFHGINYEKSNYVIVESKDNDDIVVLKISIILIESLTDEICFYGESFEMWYDESLGLYESIDESKQLNSRANFHDLILQKPVFLFHKNKKMYLSLPYSFPNHGAVASAQ